MNTFDTVELCFLKWRKGARLKIFNLQYASAEKLQKIRKTPKFCKNLKIAIFGQKKIKNIKIFAKNPRFSENAGEKSMLRAPNRTSKNTGTAQRVVWCYGNLKLKGNNTESSKTKPKRKMGSKQFTVSIA